VKKRIDFNVKKASCGNKGPHLRKGAHRIMMPTDKKLTIKIGLDLSLTRRPMTVGLDTSLL